MRLKLSLYGAAVILLALGLSYFFKLFIDYADYTYLVAVAVIGLFFLAGFLLQILFFPRKNQALWLMVGEIIALALPFLLRPTVWLFVSLVAVALLFWLAYLRGRSTIENSLEIKLSRIQHRAMVFATLAVAIFLIANFFSTFRQDKLSEEAFRYVPETASQQSVGDVLGNAAGEIYEEELESLPPEQQEAFLASLVDQLKEIINNFAGARLELNENIVVASQKLIDGALDEAPPQLRSILFIGFLSLLFFVLSGGAFVTNVLVGLLAWVIYKLLLFGGFAYITTKEVNQEVMTIS